MIRARSCLSSSNITEVHKNTDKSAESFGYPVQVGDILVLGDRGAQLLVAPQLADFLCEALTSVRLRLARHWAVIVTAEATAAQNSRHNASASSYDMFLSQLAAGHLHQHGAST